MNYTWRPADGQDIDTIVNLSNTQLQEEVDGIFKIDLNVCKHNCTLSVVNQYFNPLFELFSVAVDENNNIIAFTVATTSENSLWSTEKIVTVKLAHVNRDLPNRTKIKLIADMLTLWESFANLANSSVIVSNSMRKNQDVFLKMHEKRGYLIRGSFAYKRLL